MNNASATDRKRRRRHPGCLWALATVPLSFLATNVWIWGVLEVSCFEAEDNIDPQEVLGLVQVALTIAAAPTALLLGLLVGGLVTRIYARRNPAFRDQLESNFCLGEADSDESPTKPRPETPTDGLGSVQNK